jgi:hypothetical protein
LVANSVVTSATVGAGNAIVGARLNLMAADRQESMPSPGRRVIGDADATLMRRGGACRLSSRVNVERRVEAESCHRDGRSRRGESCSPRWHAVVNSIRRRASSVGLGMNEQLRRLDRLLAPDKRLGTCTSGAGSKAEHGYRVTPAFAIEVTSHRRTPNRHRGNDAAATHVGQPEPLCALCRGSLSGAHPVSETDPGVLGTG